MAPLAHTRSGDGASLVLLHGIGSSRHMWDPIVPALAEHFDVLTVDLPGFGQSEPLTAEVEPLPAALAVSVAALLDDLGIVASHVVGNSLGGWVALELTHIRPAASVTLLSPAGLWRDTTPHYARFSLRASRWFCRHAGGLLSRLVRYRLGRILILGQTHGRPARMSADQARTTIHAMGTCPGFDATLAATTHRRYLAPSSHADASVTVAFGSRDLILLPWQSRHLDQLPAGTNAETLPGCGHIPTFDDPDAVTSIITRSIARAAEPSERLAH